MTTNGIELYTGNSLDARKVSIALEELGLEYRVIDVDTSRPEQRPPGFFEISPANQIPALVDGRGDSPYVLFDSGAILSHLARTEGALWPSEPERGAEATSWLWYVSGLGAIAASAHHFRRSGGPPNPEATAHFERATRRRYGVLNARLERQRFFLDAYSMVDIAAYPWVFMHFWQDIDLAEYPALARWKRMLDERPAVATGLRIPTWDEKC